MLVQILNNQIKTDENEKCKALTERNKKTGFHKQFFSCARDANSPEMNYQQMVAADVFVESAILEN
jgi:hypothetical protein